MQAKLSLCHLRYWKTQFKVISPLISAMIFITDKSGLLLVPAESIISTRAVCFYALGGSAFQNIREESRKSIMLNECQLLERIQQIQEDGMTGILELKKDSQSISVCFDKGLIAACVSNIEQLQLGRILYRRGLLQNTDIPELLALARRKHVTLGKAAVSRGLLSEIEIRDGVHDQIVQLVIHALYNDFEIHSFKDTHREAYLPARLNVDQLILDLARTEPHSFPMDGEKQIFLKSRYIIPHLPFFPEELFVLSQLKKPRAVKELPALTGMEIPQLSKILGVFDTLQLIGEADIHAGEATAMAMSDDFFPRYLTPEIGDSELSKKIEVFHNPSSFVSEQFKSLKVKIAEMARQAQAKVIAVSSPDADDGKSLVGVNLAVSLSNDPGRRVALVDCDLRNPNLHRFLGISANPGLVEYLDGDSPEVNCYMRRLGRLYLVTAGSATANPVDLLSKARMKDMIAQLKVEFDTVILDCPPSGPISDAQILTGLADGFLMVVRCGKTSYGSTKMAFRNLDQSKLIGLVFNDVKPLLFNTQYDHKYYYYGNRQRYPYAGAKITHRRKTYLE